MMRIGVISDTHGLLRPEAVEALLGSEMIVHAGDVGAPEILDMLGDIAPVIAVRGNVDHEPWARKLPSTKTVEVGEARLYVLHNLAELRSDPAAQGYAPRGYAGVISGHSHQPLVEKRGDVLYLNPGSAGPRRFRLPVTLAVLTVQGEHVEAEIIHLRVAD